MKQLLALAVMALFAVPSFTKADVEDRLYDFTDAYYLQNGVNPALIGGRMEAGTGIAGIDTPIFSYQRNVRALLTLSAYDHSSNINYFTVLGGSARTPSRLTQLDRMPARLRTASPIPVPTSRHRSDWFHLSPIIGARHAERLLRQGSAWSLDSYGVNFTPKALTTRAGKQFLNGLARQNGKSFDGTPIIATQSDIDSLLSKATSRL